MKHPLLKSHKIGPLTLVPVAPLEDGRDVNSAGEPGWRHDWVLEGRINGQEVSATALFVFHTGMVRDIDEAEVPLPPVFQIKFEHLWYDLQEAELV